VKVVQIKLEAISILTDEALDKCDPADLLRAHGVMVAGAMARLVLYGSEYAHVGPEAAELDAYKLLQERLAKHVRVLDVDDWIEVVQACG
jgi:hypothetical protein